MITISIGITWSRVLGNIDTISEFPRHLMKCTVFIFRKLSVLSERRRGEVAVSAGQAALNMVKWNSKAHATPASQRKYTVAHTNTLGSGPVCSHKRRSNNLQWSDEKPELSENGSPRYPLLRWYSLQLRLGRGGEGHCQGQQGDEYPLAVRGLVQCWAGIKSSCYSSQTSDWGEDKLSRFACGIHTFWPWKEI